jgi:pimeloyl-ACP methyl ester carboxylesterase
MPYVDVGRGIKLFVQVWGAGKNVVFVHGWPFDHRIFEYQMMALAEHDFRVVGIDLRGFGQSDKPWEGNEYDHWAADVGKVLAGLPLRDVILVGFSIGGAIAAHHLARFRDTRIAKLMLAAAPLPSAARSTEDKEGYNMLIRKALRDKAAFTHEMIGPMFNTPVSAEYAHWLDSIGRGASLRATVRVFEELRDRDIRPQIGNIRIPTRILHGVHDKIVPFELAEEQQRLIRNAALVRFENSGHALFWDERDKFVEEIAKFAAEDLVKAA